MSQNSLLDERHEAALAVRYLEHLRNMSSATASASSSPTAKRPAPDPTVANYRPVTARFGPDGTGMPGSATAPVQKRDRSCP